MRANYAITAITTHCYQQWDVRFGGDIVRAIDRSLPFGVQLGTKSRMYHDDETDAVFVVSQDRTAITVMPRIMAIVNAQAIIKRKVKL